MTDNNSIVWVTRSLFEQSVPWQEHEKFCQAPRHRGKFIQSHYVLFLREDESLVVVQAMCQDCMEMIANDLSTTAVKGAVSELP